MLNGTFSVIFKHRAWVASWLGWNEGNKYAVGVNNEATNCKRHTPPATLTYEIFSTCYHPLTSDCDLDAIARRGERKDGDNNRFWFLSSHLQAICFCYKAKCVNSHKTCSISLLSCLDLITISKPFLSPIGGPQEKRVKSRLLPFTAKPKEPKEPKEQRMKLEYKRMKLNTPPTTVYVRTNSCVFCRLFYVLGLLQYLKITKKCLILFFGDQNCISTSIRITKIQTF